jgi:soluble lytic murein transglycosylase
MARLVRVPGHLWRGRRATTWLCGVLALLIAVAAPPPASALDPKDRDVVGDAFRAAAAGDWDRAASILEPVTDPLPAKTLRWLRLLDGQGTESFAEMARLLLANPHWPRAERLQVMAEDRINDPADHELIRRFFAARPALTTRGMIRHAEALLAAGEREAAADLLRRAWVEGDFSTSEAQKFRRIHGRHLTVEDHVARLDNLLWDRRHTAAGQMLELMPAGERRLAEARLRLQRRQPGVDRAIREVPGELRNHPGLLFDRLQWRRHKRLHDGVIEILLDPPADLGRPEPWWFEREFQIRRALRARDFDLAWRLAERHGQSEGLAFAEAEWLAGWLALRFRNQPRTALRHFERLHDGVGRPISLARGAYWAGRAAASLGDGRGAETWYRRAAQHHTTFYGQMAAAELGQSLTPLIYLPATASQRAAFEGKELVRVARMLIAADAGDHLNPFMLRLVDDAATAVEVGLVGELAAASGRPHLVTAVGKYASYDGRIDEAAAFPIPNLRGFTSPPPGDPDPALLLAVARQESVFNSWVVSSAGARGIMQLMPATAETMARQLGLRYNLGLLTGDPEYNIRLGSHYLRGLLRRYGELALVLAGYNAGPSRVEEWLQLHGDPRGRDRHALIDWIELIPFKETRNYVQRVIENHEIYRRRFLGETPATVAMRPVNGPLDPVPVPLARPATGGSGSSVATRSGPLDPPPLPAPRPDGLEVVPAGFDDPARGEPAPGEGPMGAVPLPVLKPDAITRLSRIEPAERPEG